MPQSLIEASDWGPLERGEVGLSLSAAMYVRTQPLRMKRGPLRVYYVIH